MTKEKTKNFNSKTFKSPAGTDLSVYFNDKQLGNVQLFEFNKNIKKEQNKMTFVLMYEVPSKETLEWFNGDYVGITGNLKLMAGEDFIYNKNITFTNFSLSIGIDDLVSEYTYTFTSNYVTEELNSLNNINCQYKSLDLARPND